MNRLHLAGLLALVAGAGLSANDGIIPRIHGQRPNWSDSAFKHNLSASVKATVAAVTGMGPPAARMADAAKLATARANITIRTCSSPTVQRSARIVAARHCRSSRPLRGISTGHMTLIS